MITTYVEGTKYPTLSMVVRMYNRLLILNEDIFNYSTKNALVRKAACSGLAKLSHYYDKSSPLVMTATYLECKMNDFIQNKWDEGGELDNAFNSIYPIKNRPRVR